MSVDGHWHARGFKQTQESPRHSLKAGEALGHDAIIVIGNTDPPLISKDRCEEYLGFADEVKSPVKFYTHIGATADEEQVEHAITTSHENERIPGIKVFFDHSTGNLGITKDEDQNKVVRVLAKRKYRKVVVGHCEEPSLNNDLLYVPENPKTWSELCRPEISEITSVKKVLRMMEDAGYEGKFHIAHTSTVEVVELARAYRGPVKLTVGLTPNHIFLPNSLMDGEDGQEYKCNPPLRKRETQEGLLERVLNDDYPLILESDHAPHPKKSRTGRPPSGLAGGIAWAFVVDELRKRGASEKRIYDLTFGNVVRLYELNITPSGRQPDFKALEALQADYAFDPFAHLKQK